LPLLSLLVKQRPHVATVEFVGEPVKRVVLAVQRVGGSVTPIGGSVAIIGHLLSPRREFVGMAWSVHLSSVGRDRSVIG